MLVIQKDAAGMLYDLARPLAPGWASLSTCACKVHCEPWTLALPREMVEDALNALEAYTCDFRDGGKLIANVYLQRVVPVVQDWLPAGRFHPYRVQQSV